jgi:TonB family protein
MIVVRLLLSLHLCFCEQLFDMKSYLIVFLALMMGIQVAIAQNDAEPDIDTFVFVEQEPKPLNMKEVQDQIGYPQAAVDSGLQGQVILRILVDESGRYLKHKVVKDVHPLLSEAVEEHVSKLVFSPAMREGKPTMFWVNIPFNFRMIDKTPEEIRQGQIETLTKQIDADPKNYQALLTRGIAYREINELDKATADFEQSMAVNPRINKKKENTLPYIFFAQFAHGTTHSMEEEWSDAIADFNLAFETAESMKMPDSLVTATLAKVYLERGFARFQLKQFDLADADYSEVIRLDPVQKCEVYSLKSELNLARENFAGVVDAMNHLIECSPEDQYLHYSRGYYKTKMEDFAGAIEDFTYTAENNRNPAFKMAALNMAGWSQMKTGNMTAANAAIEKSLAMNVLNPQTYYYRGLIRLGDNNAAEACKDLARAVDYGLEGDELTKAEALIKEKCNN